MLQLTNESTSYFIISAFKSENNREINEKLKNNLRDDLYLKDYIITPIDGYYKGLSESSYIAQRSVDNNELRQDSIELMTKYDQDEIVIKYIGEDVIKKIELDGNERNLVMGNFDPEHRSYIFENITFSLMDQKRYRFPKNSEEFKVGYVVEMMGSSGNWIQKEVTNPNDEWDNLYKTLSKYDRVRIEY
jgi:hypothetical protein